MPAPADKPRLSKPERITLPTVLLRHLAPAENGGEHYDWMMVDPRTADDANARLWTARVTQPSSRWASLREWDVEMIGTHRREYLTYEGPVSGNRGTVTRVDEGTFVAVSWTEERIEIEIGFKHYAGRVVMTRQSPTRWRAVI